MAASAYTDRESVKRFGFAEFVRLAWHQIEKGEELVFTRHMDLMCKHYEAVARGEIKKLVVTVPPGMSKSSLSSVLFPAWDWIENPQRKYIFTSFDEDLSHEFARKSLELMKSEWFRERWPHVEILGGDRAAKSWFHNSHGGQRVSTMFGGGVTGRHAHFLFVDDPTKARDLEAGGESAAAVLDRVWRTWTGTFMRRVANAKTFAYVCIMQRLHEEDLAGRLLKGKDVVHLCLPMRFEPHRKCVTPWGEDWRTEPGELLCPERFPEEYVYAQEHSADGMTPRDVAAQYQQRPAPESGSLFRREYFDNRWDTLPPGGRFIMSVDSSLKGHKEADFCVMQVWYYIGANFYLVDQVRERLSFSATIDAMKNLRARWPKIGQVLVEDKANGTAIVDTLKSTMTGVLAVNPEGGKFARANAIEPLLRAGNVFFPKHMAWMPHLIEEHATFPVGSHDDTVDCLTQALLFMSGKTKKSKLRTAMSNVRTGKSAFSKHLLGF